VTGDFYILMAPICGDTTNEKEFYISEMWEPTLDEEN
jgi:hypothetical protein